MGRTQLSVVLMVVCAVKCLAMSYDDLEDFADYIKRTSQLSPILKSVEADEEDEVVSDDAWEESGKFEGDLILNERQRRLIVENVAEGLSRNGIRDGTKRWPNNEVIYYIQVEHFRNDQVQAIMNGIDDLARASCVKFRRYVKGDRDAVVIQGSRKGCFSQVGYQGGYQVLNLSGRHPAGRGCFRHGTIVHELLHTLGFYHMQSSPVRDDYVDIAWDNIVKSAKHNFRKYNSFSVSDFGVGYDYESVLHYSRHAFSSNGRDTIVPKTSSVQIGQRIGLSDKDTRKLNKMYCDPDVDNEADDVNKSKKKSFKNKPLNIQGLGYHQGKAVVFNVSPTTAAPYKLADDPSSYTFDYFSKTPQILSSPENEDFHVGKKVAPAYNALDPLIQQEYVYEEPVYYYDSESEKNSNENKLQPPNQHQSNHNVTEIKDSKKASDIADNGDSSVETKLNEDDDTQNPALIEAFDRLSKIIKSHVYPSHTPDLSIYKINKQPKNHESNLDQPTKEKVDYVIIAPIRNSESKSEKMDTVVHLIKNLYDLNNYQALKILDSQYNPNIKVKGSHDDDTKKYNKNKELVAKRPKKDRQYVDPSYTMSLSQYEDEHSAPLPYASSEQYREQDEFSKCSSKKHDGERSHGNHDEWHHKYTPYTYKPTERPMYDSRAHEDYLNDSSEDEYYGSSVPVSIKEYILYPLDSQKYYNDVSSQENR